MTAVAVLVPVAAAAWGTLNCWWSNRCRCQLHRRRRPGQVEAGRLTSGCQVVTAARGGSRQHVPCMEDVRSEGHLAAGLPES